MPISRSSREVKLLYSEYQHENDKSNKLNAKIAQVLKIHKLENKKARRMVIKHGSNSTTPGQQSAGSLSSTASQSELKLAEVK